MNGVPDSNLFLRCKMGICLWEIEFLESTKMQFASFLYSENILCVQALTKQYWLMNYMGGKFQTVTGFCRYGNK